MARIDRPQEQVLTLSEIEREELDRLGRSQPASHSLVRRSHPRVCGGRDQYIDRDPAWRLEPDNLPLAQDMVQEGTDWPLRRSTVWATEDP